jgi:DNA-directed RNA polymerase subunit beta'
VAKFDGVVDFSDLKTVPVTDPDTGDKYHVVTGRMAEYRLVDPNTEIVLMVSNVSYGSKLYFNEGDKVKKGDTICEWDPYNALIISEEVGEIHYVNLVENINFVEESDEQTGFTDRIVIETRDKTKNPEMQIINKNGDVVSNFNIPVGAHMMKREGDKVGMGEILVKIPRSVGKAGDITGGLPRVTELFEARNPSNPAVVSEINGEVSFGKIKRARREVFVTAKTGEVKKYLIPLSKQILVQENDYIKAGTVLSDGAITPSDILAIEGATKVQEYIVNEVQEVYRLQGVKINDKHFEVIVRQMLKKVEVVDPGDTRFLEGQLVDKIDLMEENDEILIKKIVTETGDSEELKVGQIVTTRKLREVNSVLKRNDKNLVEVRDANPATSKQVLQGITKASLQTKSFMSAASFQETTKILNDAAIRGKVDFLEGLKENVICGNAISAGTGMRQFEDNVVGSQEEFDKLKNSEKAKIS